MQLSVFNGGVSSFKQPQLIQQNESVICENADIGTGAVVSHKKHKLLNTQSAKNMKYFNSHWIASDENRDYINFQQKIFYSNGETKPQFSDDGVQWYNLGIDKPSDDSLEIIYNTKENEFNIRLLYGFMQGQQSEEHQFSKNLKVYTITQKNIKRFIGFTAGRVQGNYSFKSKSLKIFKNMTMQCYEISDTDDSVGTINIGCYKEFTNLSDFFVPVIEICPTSYYPNNWTNPGVPSDYVTDEGLLRKYFAKPLITGGWFVKTDKDSGFIARKSRLANNGVRGNYAPSTARETTWSSYVSSEYDASKTINKPLVMRPDSEIIFIVKDSNNKVIKFIPVTLPNTFESKNFKKNPNNGADIVFGGFSFDWTFQQTESVDIYVDGFKFASRKYSDLKNGRIIVNSEINETDTFNTLEKVKSELENVDYIISYQGDYIESIPSNPVSCPQLDVQTETLTFLKIKASTDPQVKYINVYRIGNGLTKYSLVTQIPNEDTTISDNRANNEIDGRICNSFNNYPAPYGLTYLTLSNAMMFGSLGSKLVFTEVAKPYTWNPLNFIEFEETISGIGDTPNGLLVFTKNKTFIVTGNSPDTFSKFLLSGNIGCESHKSIQQNANSLVWVSKEGVNISNGGEIVTLTQTKLPPFSVLSPFCSCILDNVYYVSFAKGTLVVNFKDSNALTFLSQVFRCFDIHDNKIFGVDLKDDFYELFGSNELEEFHYKSPSLCDSSISELKTYKNIYVYVNGSDFTFEVYIEDKLVTSTTLKDGLNEVKVSANDMQGCWISFSVKGKGILREIEYIAVGRQNGR